MAEPLHEELARLVDQYKFGERQLRDEAWNLIADFTVENVEPILAALFPAPDPDLTALRARVKDLEEGRSGIYVASKTKHAPMWKSYRERGWPINSTWIDEAGAGESGDLADLWRRCTSEAASANVLVIYREPEDVLKGAWVELGAALVKGVPVFAVGLAGFTIEHDTRITHFTDLPTAMDAAAEYDARTLLKGAAS